MTSLLPSVLIVYNTPRSPDAAVAGFHESDAGVLDEVAAVEGALHELAVPTRAVGIHDLGGLARVLEHASEPVVFNLVEELPPAPAEATFVPVLCRVYGKACTGTDTEGLGLCLDKWRTKALLRSCGIPVPADRLVMVGSAPDIGDLGGGPFVVKPIRADASEGVSFVPSGGEELAGAVDRIHRQFGQPALIEQYWGWREINVSLMEHAGHLRALPPAEIDFSHFGPEQPRVVDYAAKWLAESPGYRNTPRLIPAPVGSGLCHAIIQTARRAWEVTGCRDYARVDIRLDRNDNIAVLEVNPNPDISIDAGFAAALAADKVPYTEFVRAMVTNAIERAPLATTVQHEACPGATEPANAQLRSMTFRCPNAADRNAVLKLVAATGFFRSDEMDVAAEVLDESIRLGSPGHYQSLVALAEDHTVIGWVCYGPTPCTLGTFDIYWLAVLPSAQRQGVGRALMTQAEEAIVKRGGRMAIVETAGRPQYGPTRRFYRRLGYIELSRAADFYAPSDDKIVYAKMFQCTRDSRISPESRLKHVNYEQIAETFR